MCGLRRTLQMRRKCRGAISCFFEILSCSPRHFDGAKGPYHGLKVCRRANLKRLLICQRKLSRGCRGKHFRNRGFSIPGIACVMSPSFRRRFAERASYFIEQAGRKLSARSSRSGSAQPDNETLGPTRIRDDSCNQRGNKSSRTFPVMRTPKEGEGPSSTPLGKFG
jgi:hypothetical protein